MKGDLIKAKLKAAGIHLGLSTIIFLGILYLILVEWYPEPFFTAEGGWQGIRLMAFVDLVLGPALTLIIYNHMKAKREIFMDLSIVAIIQISALIWGGYMVYSKRPVVLAFYESAFYTVTNDYFEMQGISKPDFTQYSDNVPPMVAVRTPKTELEQSKFNTLTQKIIPIYAHAHLYETLDKQLKKMSNRQIQIDIEEVMEYNEVMKKEIVEITNNKINDYYYFALQAKFHNLILVLSNNGQVKGMVKAPIRKR